MAPKRRGKRAAAGGGGSTKKRGRPSKKQAEAEAPQEATDESKQTDQPEQSEQAGSADSAASTSAATTDQSSGQGGESKKEVGGEGEGKEGAVEGKEGGGPKTTVLEKGLLYFFYRPKVDAKEVRSVDDVQKFYLLMSPEGAEGKPAREEELEGKRGEERKALEHQGKPLHRLLVLPVKSLPDPSAPQLRPWAFVDAVSSDLHEVEHPLERYSYDTKTRGHREIQPARLAGEAFYELVVQAEKESHFVYRLEFPEEPSEVQKAFHIYKAGQFLVTVKNPVFNTAAYSQRWAGFKGDAKASFPQHLMDKFKGKVKDMVRYCMLDTAEFLNHQHCELVLLPSHKDAKLDLGKVVEDMEREADDEAPHDEAAVYDKLDTDPKHFPDAAESFK